jgi:hypothetical protein
LYKYCAILLLCRCRNWWCLRACCVCVCLSLPLQVDISPFSTSTDTILKPCALGILSLHSDRRNETDALEATHGSLWKPAQ